MERQDKGLCYNCDDKYSPGHRCKMQRLYLLDDSGTEDECGSQEIESTQEEVENLNESETEETPEISLHAMAGTTSPQTMRLRGHLGRQPVVILIDSGSTHNFIDPTASK